jgi:regulatory protein
LWDYALRVLGVRAHSASELRQKLSRRAETPSDLEATLQKLRDYGLADDRKFSEAFATGRLESSGFGRFRVLRDLRAKRVASTVAQTAVEKVFAETDEVSLIERYLERKYRGQDLRKLLKNPKHMASVYRRLRTAGFGSGAALAVLRRLGAESDDWTGAEEEDGA